MAGTNRSTAQSQDEIPGNLLWTSPVWSMWIRALGVVAALFLGYLAYKQGTDTAGTITRTFVYGLSAVLLILPWNLFSAKCWKPLFILFLAVMAALVFAQMVEVLSLYSSVSTKAQQPTDESLFQLATGSLNKATKPRPPIDRGIILFFALLQIPAILFRRHPQILR